MSLQDGPTPDGGWSKSCPQCNEEQVAKISPKKIAGEMARGMGEAILESIAKCDDEDLIDEYQDCLNVEQFQALKLLRTAYDLVKTTKLREQFGELAVLAFDDEVKEIRKKFAQTIEAAYRGDGSLDPEP